MYRHRVSILTLHTARHWIAVRHVSVPRDSELTVPPEIFDYDFKPLRILTFQARRLLVSRAWPRHARRGGSAIQCRSQVCARGRASPSAPYAALVNS